MVFKNVKAKCLDYQGKAGSTVSNVCPLVEPYMVYQTSERRKGDPAFVRMLRIDASGERSFFDIDLEDLAKKDTTIAALLTNLVVFDTVYSMDIWRYLLNETRNLTERHVVTYLSRRLGWQSGNEGDAPRFLLGASSLPDGSILTYRDVALDFVRGSDADYQCFLKNEIYGKDTMEFALIAGLTSIVSGYVGASTAVSALAINVSSQSTSGKTTMLDFIGSLYGSPSHSNSGLVRTFNATKNAILAACEGRNGIPIILDDINANASEHNRIDMVMQLVAGTSRGRCDSTGSTQEDRLPWHGVAFITSESPIFDAGIVNQGIQARCLTIDNVKWTEDAAHSERIKRFVSSNYGHVAPAFAAKVAQLGEAWILADLETSKNEILGKMKDQNHLSSRLAAGMAPFLVTAHIYKDHFYKRLRVPKLLKMLVDAEQASHEEGSLADRVMEKLEQFIVANGKRFCLYYDGQSQTQASGTCIGCFAGDEKRGYRVSILKEPFEKFLDEIKCTEKNTVLREWVSKGKIVKDKDHWYTKESKLGNMRCLRMKFWKLDRFGLAQSPFWKRGDRGPDDPEPEHPPESDMNFDSEEAIDDIFKD